MTPEEFGELIRSNREARGLTVDELAGRFKLSVSTLKAIECGNLDRLPHVVYARGFVRSYAQAVGIEGDVLEQGIDAVFPQHLFEEVPTVPTAIASKPARYKSGGDKFVAFLLILLLLILPLGAGWFVITNYGDQILEMIKKPLSATSVGSTTSVAGSLPESLQSSTADTTPFSRIEETNALVENTVSQVQTAENSPPQQVLQSTAAQPLEIDAQSSVSSNAVVQQPSSPSRSSEGKQVSIIARKTCWVQAMVDGAGARTFHVHPGETSILPYKRKITLTLGNAGGVDIIHNGKSYPLNARPDERRTLDFD